MAQQIVIVDYGMGNLNSVRRKLERLKANCEISNDPEKIRNAQKIILPGVGSFGKAMRNINNLHLKEALDFAVIQRKAPVLGICLGMQLMCEHSEEGNCDGLGWVQGVVKQFDMADKQKFKVPHMGWNTVQLSNNSVLMNHIESESEFYFVHSFFVKLQNQDEIINVTDYGSTFVSGFQKENIFGLQYHPEKSHEAGDQIFQNFIDL